MKFGRQTAVKTLRSGIFVLRPRSCHDPFAGSCQASSTIVGLEPTENGLSSAQLQARTYDRALDWFKRNYGSHSVS